MTHRTIVKKLLSGITDIKRDSSRKMFDLDTKSVTFVAINGSGLGHLTRCLSIACELRKANPKLRISFFTTSIAIHLVARLGFECHHCPPISLAGTGCSRRQWRTLLSAYLDSHLEHTRAHTLIFDGTAPYPGIVDSITKKPELLCIWIKRGLYKKGIEAKTERFSHLFNKTIVPTELQQSDLKPSSENTIHVAPIVSCDMTQTLSKQQACNELGLNPNLNYVYMQLGAGNLNHTSDIERHVITEIQRHGGYEIIRGQSPISMKPIPAVGGVRTIESFPNSRYFSAFNFAVLAGGYNSVYESIYKGLPAIFIPNEETASDNQIERVKNVSRQAAYTYTLSPLADDWAALIGKIAPMKPHQDTIEPLRFPNGAVQAAKEILESLPSNLRR